MTGLAALHFLRPMDGRPVAYQYDPPPGVPQRTGDYDPQPVVIRDARPLAAGLSLDGEGFALLDRPSVFADFGDQDAIRSVYYREVEGLIAGATGAALVIAFDHNIRSAARAAGDAGIRPPVERTHNDFTARSGPDRAARELRARGLDADRLLESRFAIVNLWRPIGRPVEKSPLALCDARSIRAEDLIPSDLVYRDRVGETYSLAFDAAQRWYYFPRLTPAEAILIKGYDSEESGVARFAAHSAFDDPASPRAAPERQSIEVRALVLWLDAGAAH
ncbi:hypothetical protein LWE61_02370 [Sphingobium sufflavum]|uniref:CmcJ/NvfI family oxidoreductase n=1 Tax=Sphingobium sufflavum TaxID=1129547 RepID=UPI001F19A7A1|nr:CmcJ/NvfI family oxidoreductase [Sphingobium sufflavum]MCE7795397.1 hypothetical protein [Sphingobium sufflavum]